MTVLIINEYFQLDVHILQLNFSKENNTLQETGSRLKTWGFFNSTTLLLGVSNVQNQCSTINLKASFSCQKPLKSKIQKHIENTELHFLSFLAQRAKSCKTTSVCKKTLFARSWPSVSYARPLSTSFSFLFPSPLVCENMRFSSLFTASQEKRMFSQATFPFSTGKALGKRLRHSYE